MKTKIIVLAFIAAFSLIVLPTDGFASDSQRPSFGATNLGFQGRGKGRGNKKWYPRRYKNYGQYRRTQVGNRRYRLERRYYYRNGIRLSRTVRIYF